MNNMEIGQEEMFIESMAIYMFLLDKLSILTYDLPDAFTYDYF